MTAAVVTAAACARSRQPALPSGFTLLELLLVVALIAAISLFAVPTYQKFVDRAYRQEVRSDLMHCAQALHERIGLAVVLAKVADGNGGGLGDAPKGPIAVDICAPSSVTQGRYRIDVASEPAAFMLTASPAIQSLNHLGRHTLASTGARTWDANADGQIDANETYWPSQ